MNQEATERVRQQIMRFDELIDVMQARLDDNRRRYERLFARLSAEAIDGLSEKEAQWKLAEVLINDTTPLEKAVLSAHYDCRDLERAFEELHGIIITKYEDE